MKFGLIQRTVQCDGRRPACDPCNKRALECTYVTDHAGDTPSMALKRQLQDLKKDSMDQGELLNHLKTLPEKEAFYLLRCIRSTLDPAKHRPSEQLAARATLPPIRTNFEFELRVRHPMAYPATAPVNTSSISLSPFSFSSVGQLDQPGKRTPSDEIPSKDRDNTPFNEPAESASHDQICSRESPQRPPSALLRPDARTSSSAQGPSKAQTYHDERLHDLSIGYWTRVPISDELAANIISFYLSIDHPTLGFFDADLFLRDLTGHQLGYCSSFLVSSLLFYACVS